MLRRTLKLSADQRQELVRTRDHDPKIAGGQAAYAVARSALLKPRHPDTVYDCMRYFEEEGLTGLFRHRQGGSEPRPLLPNVRR